MQVEPDRPDEPHWPDEPRGRLLAERADAAARVDALRAEFGRVLEDTADRDADDEHDIEGASMPFEREQMRATLRQAAARLVEVDAAISRLAAGTYGVCQTCGRRIDAGRLAARPSARTCVACPPPSPEHR
ncbi:Transcriptional regulator, TraR/DksA family [Frankia canadensis]|uniref:Transcriptional regulator, TraR/DksA family n=1 Tax=Frankia canadensis TaxID=1836972 RepID=A0A2I2KVD5_9ACTN|nr:TraR/DksA C4-type zinc finger protein [Frankia canadensis]SNQ49618.1 Transcriptional regulator, TraR/DksA family [Frankia canadensis]SOU56908.1 Transcriptional regulator, TraR/DksA family [Frankia canadensis]